MTYYARIAGGIVVEIVTLPDEISPGDAFHPDVAAGLHLCEQDVREGWLFGGGIFSAPPAPVIDLDALKIVLKTEVDRAAETERLKYITAGAGQAMTYQRKAEEARACLSASDPQPADYPMLAVEIGITAVTLTGVAEVVNAAYYVWLAIGAGIEAVRLGAKAAIDAAETAETARAAANVIWPAG